MSEQREQPEPKRCECGQSDFDGRVWSWRGVGTRRVCVANSTLSGYCPSCGCRLSVVAGEPAVGPSVEKLLAALYREMNRHRCEITPEHIAAPVLRSYGLAATYADAQALWARMEDAAKCG